MNYRYGLLRRGTSAHYSFMLVSLLILAGCASDLTQNSEPSDVELTGVDAAAAAKGGRNGYNSLAGLTLSPASVTLETGATHRFIGTVKLTAGGTSTTVPLKWSATGGTIEKGLYTAHTPGVHRVIATTWYGTFADTSVVTVSGTAGATLVSLAVSPGSPTLAAGATQRFAVSGKLSDGTTTVPSVTWTVNGGTITSDGLYTAGSTAGTYRAVATHVSKLADTATITITAIGSSPTDPPTSVAGCPASGYRRVVNVASAYALNNALSAAQPGDQIQMAPGTYSGTIYPDNRGTATDSITLCGPSTAVISGAVHMTGAQYWRLQGFQVRGGWIGLQVMRSTNNRISGLEVHQVGHSGIKLFDGSSHNVLTGNWIHHTGRQYPKYGEGVYVGEGQSGATTAQRVADFNRIEGNRIGPYVTAEAVDLKIETRGNRVLNNEIDATGFTLIWLNGKTTGVIDGNGTDQIIAGNTVRNVQWTAPPGETTPNWGVFRSYRSSGAGVVFKGNVIVGPTTARRAFDLDNADATVARCDNVKPSTLPWGTSCTN